MPKGLISNMSFSSRSLDGEMKLLKIKGAFQCDETRAEEILKVINDKGTIESERSVSGELMRFGIYSDFESFEDIEIKKQRAVEKEEMKKRFEIQKNLANSWFESLSEEEKEYVQILSHSRFYSGPVG
jgi:hypothetical protein